MNIRNRIKDHRRVRAGDLVPHEWNFRTHPELQRSALLALYSQVGFARSLLAYELPDGRLKLIDGHLRRDIDPDMEVEVEVLDVTEEEAQALLLGLSFVLDGFTRVLTALRTRDKPGWGARAIDGLFSVMLGCFTPRNKSG